MDIGGLTPDDFRIRLITDWTPLASNDLSLVPPYLEGVVGEYLDIPEGLYFLSIRQGEVSLWYPDSGFTPSPANREVAIPRSKIGNPEFNQVLGHLTSVPIDFPLLGDCTVHFPYAPVMDGGYLFTVRTQWDVIQDLLGAES